jgi:hypothetical protein
VYHCRGLTAQQWRGIGLTAEQAGETVRGLHPDDGTPAVSHTLRALFVRCWGNRHAIPNSDSTPTRPLCTELQASPRVVVLKPKKTVDGRRPKKSVVLKTERASICTKITRYSIGRKHSSRRNNSLRPIEDWSTSPKPCSASYANSETFVVLM